MKEFSKYIRLDIHKDTIAAAAPESPGDLAVRLFSPAYGGEELLLPKREISEPMVFPE